MIATHKTTGTVLEIISTEVDSYHCKVTSWGSVTLAQQAILLDGETIETKIFSFTKRYIDEKYNKS